jgi:hypothetical protein
VECAERGDGQTLRGGTAEDVTWCEIAGNVRKQEIVSLKVRRQWNLKEPALMLHLGAEMLAMQLVIRQLPPELRRRRAFSCAGLLNTNQPVVHVDL